MDKDINQHRSHSKNLLMVHLIFVTKYRKKLFCGDFRNDINSERTGDNTKSPSFRQSAA